MLITQYRFDSSKKLALTRVDAAAKNAVLRRALNALVFGCLLSAVAGCGTLPVARTDGHIKSEDTNISPGVNGASSVPQPVRQVALPPPPTAKLAEIKYSVVVKDVNAQELLFAISRDTGRNIDIDPKIEGKVTLNAIDQSLQEILARIAKQLLLVVDEEGTNIVVRLDTPYLHLYTVNYINMSRESSGKIGVQTQVVGPAGAAAAAGGSTGSNSSTLQLENKVKNDFWTTLEKNIKDMLLEEGKYVPRGRLVKDATQNSGQTSGNSVIAKGDGEAVNTINSGKSGDGSAGKGNQNVVGTAAASQAADGKSSATSEDFKEENPVIVNRETGTISVRATKRLQEKVSNFINHLVSSSSRQVLIEATVVEVVLNDKYQSGVDWAALGLDGLGYSFKQNFTGGNLQESPFFSLSYRNPNAASGGDISNTVRLLNSFGNTKVLSSPKIMTLNNQTAVMRVVENSVYFTVQSTVTAGQQGQASTVSYNTTPNVVPEGFIMNVTPQIGEDDMINLNVRPSVTRITSYVNDPNPDLGRAGVVSRVPVIQTREFETMMRVANGQTAVLGGLMQDSFAVSRDGLPILSRIPVIGDWVSYRNDLGKKSELVVFIRARVIRAANVNADLSDYRRFLPDAQFFKDASPSYDPMKSGSPNQSTPNGTESEPRKAP